MLIHKAYHFSTSPKTLSAMFFDRDGVINEILENEGFRGPRNISETIIKGGVEDGLKLSSKANYLNIVVTNQPDVSRGFLSIEDLNEVHNLLMNHLPCIDAIITCTHVDSDGCVCRKPNDGMLRFAAQEFNIDLLTSFMIGDRWVDIEAGRNAGVKTVLIESTYSWNDTSSGRAPENLVPDFIISGTNQIKDLFAKIIY